MAKLDNNTRKGRLGEFIYYNWKGKQCIRAKPRKFKRTEASIRSSLNFGKASTINRQIREFVDPINPSEDDVQVMFKFTGALNKFISWKEKQIEVPVDLSSGLPFLKDFQFNNQADLSNMTFVKVSSKITASGNLEISLPYLLAKESVPYFTLANQIMCKMVLTGTDLDKVETEQYGNAAIDIMLKNEILHPPIFTMRTATEPGKLMILVMALQYFVGPYDGTKMLTDKNKLPCGIALAYLS